MASKGSGVSLGGSEHREHSLGDLGGGTTFVLAVTLMVFAAALLGIFTRPVGLLAAFWPANAVFLGLLICNTKRISLLAWIGAFIAYIFADLLTGGDLLITFWLTLANIGGAAAGYSLYRRLPDTDRMLGQPSSVLVMFCVCATAAVVAAVLAAGSTRILFDQGFLSGLGFWFSGELVNYLAILPVILTFAGRKSASAIAAKQHNAKRSLGRHLAPLTALIFSLMMGMAVGGPGAISFAVPALLWCALSYSMFFTSLCTLGFCAWMLIAIASGVMGAPIANEVLEYTSSAKLGIALISIAPLAAAVTNASRLSLVAKLAQAAHYDFLTRALARGEFIERSRGLLRRGAHDGRPVAVLMLDIDRFKQINDIHGHAVGDEVLSAFAETIKGALRTEDVFGRIGGEEFGLVIPGQGSDQALATADRIRQVVAEHCPTFVREVDDVTVSIGVVSTDRHPGQDIEDLLRLADQALYKAKRNGRDRVAQI